MLASLLDKAKKRPLSYGKVHDEIEKSKTYSPNEPRFVTKQSPRSFVAFHSQATYDILIQIDVGDRANRQEVNDQPNRQQVNGRPDTLEVDSQAQQNTRPNISRHPSQSPKAVAPNLSLFVEALLVCLTGALHAAAWNSNFPTAVEMWLWRGSSLAMCLCCLGLFLIANFTEYEQDLIACVWKFNLADTPTKKFFGEVWREIVYVSRKHAGLLGKNDGSRNTVYYLHQIGIWTTFFFVSVYFFAVLFITVESYLSLRSPVIEVFTTVPWINYWPHV